MPGNPFNEFVPSDAPPLRTRPAAITRTGPVESRVYYRFEGESEQVLPGVRFSQYPAGRSITSTLGVNLGTRGRDRHVLAFHFEDDPVRPFWSCSSHVIHDRTH